MISLVCNIFSYSLLEDICWITMQIKWACSQANSETLLSQENENVRS